MSPQDVDAARAKLTAAIAADDEDAGFDAIVTLLCGTAFNIARIAEKLAPEPQP